jgi:methionyl-tRNA synthetase
MELRQEEGEGAEEGEVAAEGEKLFHRWWPALHVIGKDIMIPAHGVYWPIMLKALGFSDDQIPPLLVHGWWNISGAKMSKSEGNVIDPDQLADKYGAETLRYYLMSDIATGKDSDFSEERLVQRYNTDLANSLGNLLNRTLSMAAKYRDGTLKSMLGATSVSDPPAGSSGIEAVAIPAAFAAAVNLYVAELDVFKLDSGLTAALSIATLANRHIEVTAPWKLAKDPERAPMLDVVLYQLAESLRIIAILLYPVMPRAAHGIFDQLGWKLAESGRSQRFSLADAEWGGLPDGHLLGPPTPLFPRIEGTPPAA